MTLWPCEQGHKSKCLQVTGRQQKWGKWLARQETPSSLVIVDNNQVRAQSWCCLFNTELKTRVLVFFRNMWDLSMFLRIRKIKSRGSQIKTSVSHPWPTGCCGAPLLDGTLDVLIELHWGYGLAHQIFTVSPGDLWGKAELYDVKFWSLSAWASTGN